MEKLTIFERRGQAKILGNLITVVGAIVMIMCKCSVLDFPWTKGRGLLALQGLCSLLKIRSTEVGDELQETGGEFRTRRWKTNSFTDHNFNKHLSL